MFPLEKSLYIKFLIFSDNTNTLFDVYSSTGFVSVGETLI